MPSELYFIFGGILLFILIMSINFLRIKKEKKSKLADKKTESLSKIVPEPEYKKASNVILSKQKYEKDLKDRLEKEIRKKELEEEIIFNQTYEKDQNETEDFNKKMNENNELNSDRKITTKDVENLSEESKAIIISEILRKKI